MTELHHLGKQTNTPTDTLDCVAWTHGPITITLEVTEFTSLCPVTAQPDFGTLTIAYVPDAQIVETRSLKLWLGDGATRGHSTRRSWPRLPQTSSHRSPRCASRSPGTFTRAEASRSTPWRSAAGDAHLPRIRRRMRTGAAHDQLAVMGAALYSVVEKVERPSVGLLNISEEDIKGNEVVKQAGELLKGSGMNYYGNVEGYDIYRGTTDVVVCDGFVGNVFLKSSEGLARMLAAYLKEEFTRNPLTKLLGLVSLPVISSFRRHVDPRRLNGASLLGLRGIVVKSHGSADSFGFGFAIRRAWEEAESGILQRISAHLPSIEEEQLKSWKEGHILKRVMEKPSSRPDFVSFRGAS